MIEPVRCKKESHHGWAKLHSMLEGGSNKAARKNFGWLSSYEYRDTMLFAPDPQRLRLGCNTRAVQSFENYEPSSHQGISLPSFATLTSHTGQLNDFMEMLKDIAETVLKSSDRLLKCITYPAGGWPPSGWKSCTRRSGSRPRLRDETL